MRLSTDMRIGKRLAVGFAIVFVLMGLIVFTGLASLGSIGKDLDHIVSVNNAMIGHASDIRAAFADVSLLIGELVAAQDASARAEIKGKIGVNREKYKRAMEELLRLEGSDEGKALIAALKEKAEKGRDENGKVMEHASAGNMKEALEKYGESRKLVEGYMSAADAVVQYNNKKNQEQYQAARKSASTARLVFVLLGALTIMIGILSSVGITRSITQPILRSTSHIDLMAKGDFSIDVAQGAMQRKDEMGVVARSMNAMNSSLRSILSEMMSSASNMAAASAQLSASAQKLSSGAEEQVERAAQVATASTQMNQATEDIARNSSKISESASETVKIARGGQEIVHKAIREVDLIAETVETASEFVRELGQQSEKIGDLVTIINEIADQTNLLALNAAIEAARAGEHGRGFAVVADEVKKLAERTSSSTTEIVSMTTAIKEGVEHTVDSMNKAKNNVTAGVEYSSRAETALQDIIASIDTLYEGIQQTASSIEEMSATTEEITKDINQISQVTKGALSSTEEITEAAHGLSGLAANLKITVQKFKI